MTQQTTTTMQHQPTLTDLVAHLSQFDGPPEMFLMHLLAVQCHIAGASGGTMLRLPQADKVEVLAVHPPVKQGQNPPSWLAHSVEAAKKVLADGRTAVVPLHGLDDLYTDSADHHLVMIPLLAGGSMRGLAAFYLQTGDPRRLEHSRERLELTISLLSLYEMRLLLQRRRTDLKRLRTAMEVLSSINDQTRLKSSAMALCNEIATRWDAERVSVGFHDGRYVKLLAMSHTEKFTRKMKLVQDIESAMEECLDQDVEVVHPAATDATFVSRATHELSARHGPSCIVSLPLRREGNVVAVLVVERAPDRPFVLDEIETLRLTADLFTARLVDLHGYDKWLGARIADDARKGLKALIGPEHTWVKATAILVTFVILFLVFAKGQDRVEATFDIQPVQLRIIPAPFDGFLQDVYVEENDDVRGSETILARLDVTELQLELAAARAELASFVTEANVAIRDGKTSDAQIASANIEKTEASIRLLEYRVAQAEIRAPIDGVVLRGDLKRQLGAPVKTGDILFEVAPLHALYAELAVPEHRIADLLTSRGSIVTDEGRADGLLATASNPGIYIPFRVQRIDPVAEVVNQRNIFRVRVELLEVPDWLRPGTQGVAKIDIGRARYAWIWTRDMINWVRMKLWL